MLRKGLCVLSAFVVSAVAGANDGWVGTGGTPKLMKGHGTVRMVREYVQIRVEPTRVKVQADFWFRNGGADTTLRVGFPDDRTDGDEAPVLKKFRSWVDGRRVRTVFQGSDEDGRWHVKSVRFPNGKLVHVTDCYETKIGIGRLAQNDYFHHWVGYTVSTGSSWKGTIGLTEVRVTIDPPLPAPLRVDGWDDSDRLTAKSAPAYVRRFRHVIQSSGVGTPRIEGRTLIYVRRNWRPTEDDNLNIILNPHRDRALERHIQGN